MGWSSLQGLTQTTVLHKQLVLNNQPFFFFFGQCLFTVCFSEQEESPNGISTTKSNYFHFYPHYLVSIAPAVTYYWFLSSIMKKRQRLKFVSD